VRDDFVTRVSGDGADGQVLRAAARFGLIAAAGELAASLGVLPWPEGEALNAAETCFKAWLEARGTTGPIEIENGIAQVRRFLELHGESRFPWAGDTDSRTAPAINRCGFRKKSLDGDDTEFLVMPEAWRSEVCAGFDAKFIAKAMADRGMLRRRAGASRSTSGCRACRARSGSTTSPQGFLRETSNDEVVCRSR
jgi:putative DNA primase/helicase